MNGSRSMQLPSLLLCLFICLLLPSCSDNAEKEPPAKAAPVVRTVEDPRPSDARLARADAVLAYHNRVQTMLGQGMLADRIHANTLIYDATWRLPVRQKGSRPLELAPPQGLFDEEEATALTQALQGMDRALNNMLGHYANLEKYVLNPAINDDGKLGRELSKKIYAAHAQYLAARKSWLEIVDRRAREAEQLILQDHPLKRQILAARDIFSQFGEVASIIASGGTDRQLLNNMAENIRAICQKAGEPPFTGVPNLERLYRAFLKRVEEYCRILKRGVTEGLHDHQRMEINAAQEMARRAYNEFARAANA